MVEDRTGRHSAFVINLIKGMYVLRRRPCLFCVCINEAIHRDNYLMPIKLS